MLLPFNVMSCIKVAAIAAVAHLLRSVAIHYKNAYAKTSPMKLKNFRICLLRERNSTYKN